MPAGLLAALLVGIGELLGRRGVDLAASVYRVDAFRRSGFALWDFRWYGGHWTLGYSVLYPALGAIMGIAVLAVVSAGLAALAFDRLARPALGSGGRAASLLFAAGTLVSSAIGQMPFLTGEAFGLAALWALQRRRRVAATALTVLSTLSSPLPAAFVALAVTAWALAGSGPTRYRVEAAAAVVAAALAPVGVSAVLFPGQGPMPYPLVDYCWEVGVAVAVGVLAGRRQPVVACGAALWVAVASLSELVPSPLGGNVGRIEDVVALPLAVAFAWTRPRVLVLPVAAIPLALSQWTPAWGALTAIPSAPSTKASFFAPLDRELAAEAAWGPPGRVEVVPTAYHWEAAYVAPVMPLARGWERQLDEADNPLFYGRAALTASSYRSWLLDNGVRFVALPNAPLDMGGVAEGALVRSGRVPGLELVWTSPDWRLYEVAGSPGIVSGPARLVSESGGRVVLDVSRPGLITVRVRYTPDWTVATGAGCVARDRSSWMSVAVSRPGTVTLDLSLLPGRAGHCRRGEVARGPDGRAGGRGITSRG